VKRAPKPGSLAFAKAYFARRDRRVLDVLRRSSVGIAGAGGLGSNVAVALARAGVGRLVIADCDRVEPSNLNRQQYFVGQVGERKVAALRENLLAINPFSVYEIHDVRITPRNAARVFARVDVLVEALDKAEAKQMLIEASLTAFPGRPVVAASGLAGYGCNRRIRSRRLGNLYVCGDESSQCPKGISPMAPRVALVAAMQANQAVELLVKMKGRQERRSRRRAACSRSTSTSTAR
jgi:sulfur carrier protein ThiS adenylyltransferase